MPSGDGGLGAALVGDKIVIGHRHVHVSKLIGEGGFSYVYLVKEISDTTAGDSLSQSAHGDKIQRSGSGSGGRSGSMGNGSDRGSGSGASGGKDSGKARQGSMGRDAEKKEMVLKVTSISSRAQRDIAEKEAKLLSRLSHPSIIKMYDTCYRTVPQSSSRRGGSDDKNKERPQHLILMEVCEGGHALDVCTKLASAGEHFDLSTLIIAFGQICNAVSYLHAQRPPIVHRDLKPANFLIKNGAYKLCDFGSAVFGHVDLKTPKARSDAEEVIQKTTTQMFRAPEMVDLYMAKKLTQATDVWALGACLYSLAFLQNCFEEGSNLAILSRKYKIPEDNPYGEGLEELIDRMLTVDSKARADMTEVILCLSAVYSGRPLPPRKERKSSSDKKKEKEGKEGSTQGGKDKSKKKKGERTGTFRTDGQGIYDENAVVDPKKPAVAKKLDPNSAAARRRQAATAASTNTGEGTETGEGMDFESFHNRFDEAAASKDGEPAVNQDMAFSTSGNPFASFPSESKSDHGGEAESSDVFTSFDQSEEADATNMKNAFGDGGGFDTFTTSSTTEGEVHMTAADGAGDKKDDNGKDGEGTDRDRNGEAPARRQRSKSNSRRSMMRRKPAPVARTNSMGKDNAEDLEKAVDDVAISDEQDKSRRRTTKGRSSRSTRRKDGESGKQRSASSDRDKKEPVDD